VSKLLDFADLAPLIGADSNASKIRRGAPVLQPKDKVLPVEPFKTDRWGSIDAAVKFSGRKIIRKEALPINDLEATVHLQDSVLTLSPLNFGVAGGTVVATIVLDGQRQPVHANLELASRHLKLKALFPTIEAMRASLGEVNGSAGLTAAGNSIAALLGSADGEVKLLVDRGTMSHFILEAAGLNIANVVLTKLFGDRQVALNCAAADFRAEDGVLTTRTFIVDTADALIHVSGDIDLAKENLALTVKPDTKGMRVLSLRAPLYVKGTFKNPDISVDKGVLALRGGGAAVLGAVAGPAALLPLIDTGTSDAADANGCVKLLAQTGGSAAPKANADQPRRQQ
jgi:uncharacterized protein involved in outer membrane biogenesis